jgi:aryl-alcohol dehydrogenase-like predicted oxidoreductase
MRYKLLGHSGLRVSEFALGTMTFGEEWGFGASREESRKQFDLFAEAGGNFIDTANRYTEGTSERIVGEYIAADRDHWVLATKYTLFDRTGDPNFAGNHRKNMQRSVEASLKRLNTDTIDLLWLHAWDATTPVDEVLRGLDDLIRAGKVGYIGISDTPAWVISRANTLAELRGWSRFAALQVEYSLVERTPERDLLPMAAALDLAVTAWGALARGVLTGKYRAAAPDEPRRQTGDIPPHHLAIADEVVRIAALIGRTPAQVALAWTRAHHDAHTAPMIPILGARRTEQLADNLAAADLVLDGEHVAALDAISAISPGFPHEFLSRPYVRELMMSAPDQIDNHRAHYPKRG